MHEALSSSSNQKRLLVLAFGLLLELLVELVSSLLFFWHFVNRGKSPSFKGRSRSFRAEWENEVGD